MSPIYSCDSRFLLLAQASRFAAGRSEKSFKTIPLETYYVHFSSELTRIKWRPSVFIAVLGVVCRYVSAIEKNMQTSREGVDVLARIRPVLDLINIAIRHGSGKIPSTNHAFVTLRYSQTSNEAVIKKMMNQLTNQPNITTKRIKAAISSPSNSQNETNDHDESYDTKEYNTTWKSTPPWCIPLNRTIHKKKRAKQEGRRSIQSEALHPRTDTQARGDIRVK